MRKFLLSLLIAFAFVVVTSCAPDAPPPPDPPSPALVLVTVAGWWGGAEVTYTHPLVGIDTTSFYASAGAGNGFPAVPGTLVTLTAETGDDVAPGFYPGVFVGWESGPCVGQPATCQFVFDGTSVEIVARFAESA